MEGKCGCASRRRVGDGNQQGIQGEQQEEGYEKTFRAADCPADRAWEERAHVAEVWQFRRTKAMSYEGEADGG